MRFIYQLKDWPAFRWNGSETEAVLSEDSFVLGKFLGRLRTVGFAMQNEAVHETLSTEILKSAEIEGESLNRDDVRSSVAKRMEISIAGKGGRTSHEAEARADMVLDATRNWMTPMSVERICAWHAAIFPTGYSGLVRIASGRFRDDGDGPMRVVSRCGMLERVHFVAPPASALECQVERFLGFVNGVNSSVPGLVHAAIAHLWFLTLHPFDDGNGRIARALTEYLLAKWERSAMRFYSLSAQIQKEKDAYYAELEHAQRNTLDVTRWVKWFAGCHLRAVEAAETTLASILSKAEFWRDHAEDGFSDNQRKMLNRLLDGFTGNLTSSKWAKMCKVSQDTASREIANLVAGDILRREGRGRSTRYVLVLKSRLHRTACAGSSGPSATSARKGK